jgi:menaquinone-9 beta-reductase
VPLAVDVEATLMVEATLNLLQAAGQTWGAVVVGAGPAGALAAHQLARQGVPTLLVERATPPRWKVCGCCLNPRAAVVLGRAGLGALLSEQRAVALTHIELRADRRSVSLPLKGNVALSREVFDTALIRAAVEAGVDFLPGTRAALDEAISEDYRKVWLHQGVGSVEVAARVVLAADGLGGQLLARAGVAEAPPEPGTRIGAGVTITGEDVAFYTPGRVYMACGRGGYLGLVRLEDRHLDLAAALDADAVKSAGGLGALARRILEEVGWPVPELLEEQPWKGTVPLTRRMARVASRRLFVIGDAAGYVEPFTGEGMSWALASAEAVAPLAARGSWLWDDGLIAQWTRRHARIVTRRQWTCRATAALLRRPKLTALVVTLLGWMPGLATPFVRNLAVPPPFEVHR